MTENGKILLIKNQNGFTLMELIISVALISIVITFLFGLLFEVRASNNGTDFNRKNQQKRAIILKNIQEDFLNREIIGLTGNEYRGEYNFITDPIQIITIKITYKDSPETPVILKIGNDYIEYNGERWNIEKQNELTHFDLNNYKYECGHATKTENGNSITIGDYFFIKLTLPIVVKEDSNNVLDDIELYYTGLRRDIPKDSIIAKALIDNSANCE